MDELEEKIAEAACSTALWPGAFGRETVGNKAYWRDIAQAALTAIEEAGWVVVPAEPTAEMVNAGTTATSGYGGPDPDYNDDVSAQWKAIVNHVTLSQAGRGVAESLVTGPVYVTSDAVCISTDDAMHVWSYATLSDSATAFDPEKQFEKDNGQ